MTAAARTSAALAAWALLLALAACERDAPEAEVVRGGGRTMGTTWSVQVVAPPPSVPAADIEPHLQRLLDRINAQMSTWDARSELSRFNAAAPNEWVSVSRPLVEVVNAALELARLTNGALDITVGPLVDLWGFGPGGGPRDTLPDDAAIEAARERTGWEALSTRREPPALKKSHALEVDLSAIAKGYAVDALAAALTSLGATDYLVEIGGELRSRGHNARGERWRIGIEVPDPGRRGLVQGAVALETGAVATSGDYRNFFRLDGKRYAHTIDPDTGWPVTHDVASVTVLHPSAMWADGLATALNVMGAEAGMKLAKARQLPVMFVLHRGDGLAERASAPFEKFRIGE